MNDGFWWSASGWVWSNWDTIKQRMEPIFRLFQKAKPSDPSERGILIIGPGGAGKSTLARLLSGKSNWLTDEPNKYDQSFGFEEFTLEDDTSVSLLVMPGQTLERNLMWDGIGRQILEGKFQGIVLVASFGHNSLRTASFRHHPAGSATKDEFLAQYLEQQRADELRVLEQLATYARMTTRKLWFLTVVTKEDLWYPDSQTVNAHYAEGQFGTALQNLRNEKGQQLFRTEAVTASIVISHWTTTANESLVKNTAGYDHAKCVGSIRRLIECLHSLMEWEKSV
jgi:energy-coupling factor transporter ATP-binding protein EcfA2